MAVEVDGASTKLIDTPRDPGVNVTATPAAFDSVAVVTVPINAPAAHDVPRRIRYSTSSAPASARTLAEAMIQTWFCVLAGVDVTETIRCSVLDNVKLLV